MKPFGAALIAAALLLIPSSILAEDQAPSSSDAPKITAPGSPPDAAPAASDLPESPFQPGDQLIGLSAGAQIPCFILPQTGEGASNLDVGADFSVSYQYFVATGWALGGNLGVSVNESIGASYLVILPLGFTAAYWWTKLPFEFSLMAEVGAYYVRDYSQGLFGPYAKIGPAAYWRASSSWSVGLQAYFWAVPELHYGDYASYDQIAGFVETALVAIYHL